MRYLKELWLRLLLATVLWVALVILAGLAGML